jgi:hypothetical protein
VHLWATSLARGVSRDARPASRRHFSGELREFDRALLLNN